MVLVLVLVLVLNDVPPLVLVLVLLNDVPSLVVVVVVVVVVNDVPPLRCPCGFFLSHIDIFQEHSLSWHQVFNQHDKRCRCPGNKKVRRMGLCTIVHLTTLQL